MVSLHEQYSLEHSICRPHHLTRSGKHYLQTIIDARKAICQRPKILVPLAKYSVLNPFCEDCRPRVLQCCEISVYKTRFSTMKSLSRQCQSDNGCCKAPTTHAALQEAALLHKSAHVAHQVFDICMQKTCCKKAIPAQHICM